MRCKGTNFFILTARKRRKTCFGAVKIAERGNQECRTEESGMQNFDFRIGLARCEHHTPWHHAPPSFLHLTLFIFQRDCCPLFTLRFSFPLRTALRLYNAVRCIRHRSALHWASQCTATASAARCVFRHIFMCGQEHASRLPFPEGRKQQCCAMGHTAQHCLPYTFALHAWPAQTYARQKDFRSDLFTTASAFPKTSLLIPRELPQAASSMLLPHPLEQGA